MFHGIGIPQHVDRVSSLPFSFAFFVPFRGCCATLAAKKHKRRKNTQRNHPTGSVVVSVFSSLLRLLCLLAVSGGVYMQETSQFENEVTPGATGMARHREEAELPSPSAEEDGFMKKTQPKKTGARPEGRRPSRRRPHFQTGQITVLSGRP